MASSGTKDRPPHSRDAQRVPHWPAATFLLRGLQGLTTCLYPLSVVKTRQMALEGSQSGLKVRSQLGSFLSGWPEMCRLGAPLFAAQCCTTSLLAHSGCPRPFSLP